MKDRSTAVIKGQHLYIRDDNKWEKDSDGFLLNSQINMVTKNILRYSRYGNN